MAYSRLDHARSLWGFIKRSDRPIETVQRIVLWGLARRFASHLVVDVDGNPQAVHTSDLGVSRHIVLAGGWEDRATLRHATEILERLERPLHPRGTFLDIGANIGTSTMAALGSGLFDRAECFEPEAENLRLLRLTVDLNRYGDRVRIHDVALSDQDGEAHLTFSPTNRGDHRVEKEATGTPVRLRKLDTLAAAGEIDLNGVTLAWIDVQGHEAHVLAGAGRLTGTGIPVVMELEPRMLRQADSLDRCCRLLCEHYRTVADLRTQTIEPLSMDALSRIIDGLDRATPGSHAAYTDLLLLP